MTYYLLNMPKRLLARKVVPEFDFASFSFDADDVHRDPEYLFIYANKERLKVKKTDISYVYQTWDDYLKSEPVSLKPCNLLENTSAQSRDLLFDVLEVKGDEIKIRSSKTCEGEDASYSDLEGWVKWRKGGNLAGGFGIVQLTKVPMKNCCLSMKAYARNDYFFNSEGFNFKNYDDSSCQKWETALSHVAEISVITYHWHVSTGLDNSLTPTRRGYPSDSVVMIRSNGPDLISNMDAGAY